MNNTIGGRQLNWRQQRVSKRIFLYRRCTQCWRILENGDSTYRNKCDFWGTTSAASTGAATYTLYVRDVYDYKAGSYEADLVATLINLASSALSSMSYFGLAKPYQVMGSAVF